jgi:hypothetical protein
MEGDWTVKVGRRDCCGIVPSVDAVSDVPPEIRDLARVVRRTSVRRGAVNARAPTSADSRETCARV